MTTMGDLDEAIRWRLKKVRLLRESDDGRVELRLEREGQDAAGAIWGRVRTRWVREYWYRRLVARMVPQPTAWVSLGPPVTLRAAWELSGTSGTEVARALREIGVI